MYRGISSVHLGYITEAENIISRMDIIIVVKDPQYTDDIPQCTDDIPNEMKNPQCTAHTSYRVFRCIKNALFQTKHFPFASFPLSGTCVLTSCDLLKPSKNSSQYHLLCLLLKLLIKCDRFPQKINGQNQLSVCLHSLPPNSGDMTFIWEDTIQSKSMHIKCKERLPPK